MFHKTAQPGEYRLRPDINKKGLEQLVGEFEGAVKRRVDQSLPRKLRKEVLASTLPTLCLSTARQLARWCKTNGPVYSDGMIVAKKISETLFGLIIDRARLGT